MKKLLVMLLSFTLVVCVYGHPLSSSKVVEVTNYKEVLSQIEYPQVCKEKGIQGKVIVSLEIDKQGRLVGYEFISSPCCDLQDAVKKALPKLRFNPAVDDHGQAIISRITMPVKFELTIQLNSKINLEAISFRGGFFYLFQLSNLNA